MFCISTLQFGNSCLPRSGGASVNYSESCAEWWDCQRQVEEQPKQVLESATFRVSLQYPCAIAPIDNPSHLLPKNRSRGLSPWSPRKAGPFKEPLPWKELGLEDYPEAGGYFWLFCGMHSPKTGKVWSFVYAKLLQIICEAQQLSRRLVLANGRHVMLNIQDNRDIGWYWSNCIQIKYLFMCQVVSDPIDLRRRGGTLEIQETRVIIPVADLGPIACKHKSVEHTYCI